MPRRKASDHDTPRLSRTRTGCLTCRDRRVKCDEGRRPGCQQCLRKGLACQRGVQLKWQAEYDNLGLTFGRSGVWKKHDKKVEADRSWTAEAYWVRYPEIQRHSFLDGLEFAKDPGNHDCKPNNRKSFDHECQELISRVRSEEITWPLLPRDKALLAYPAMPQQGRLQAACSPWVNVDLRYTGTLLQYFIQRLCPLTTVSDPEASPFLHIIVPFLTTADGLALDAVLALSARHLAKHETSWQLAATRLECKALSGLRARLDTFGREGTTTQQEIWLAMMIFCLLEIINARDSKWVVHLKGARSLLRAGNAKILHDRVPDELMAFTNRFFAFQDVIGRTACGEEPIFGSECWQAEDRTVNAWLGCSPALVSIVCGVTELSREKPDLQAFELEGKSALLEQRLESLEQVLPKHDDEDLRRCADVKHVAAQVYMHCALHGSGPRTPFIRESVNTILGHLQAFIRAGKGAGLLWPLFVGAVELDPMDDCYIDVADGQAIHGRSFILEALEHMGNTSLSNTIKARHVITQVWHARDEACGEVTRIGSYEALVSDWDRFVAPVSHSISLA